MQHAPANFICSSFMLSYSDAPCSDVGDVFTVGDILVDDDDDDDFLALFDAGFSILPAASLAAAATAAALRFLGRYL